MTCETTGKMGGGCRPPGGCNCGCGHRRFLGKEERIEMLENYRKGLEKEIQGVEEALREMKK